MTTTADRDRGTGFTLVESQVTCTITRFRVKSVLDTLRFLVLFRRIKNESRSIDGLIASEFLISGLTTCFTLAIWRNADAILQFNSLIDSHVHAANYSFQRLAVRRGRPTLWSAQFRLHAVSGNLRWDENDDEIGVFEEWAELG